MMMNTIDEITKIPTAKGCISIQNTNIGYRLTSPGGTHHECRGRNMFYSADLLNRKLVLFYGKVIARKAMDAHFKHDLTP